jgi:hypothetical protein
MLKKLAVLVSVLFAVSIAVAQSGGTIKGQMLDKGNGEPLPFANVVLMKGGSQVAGTMTDFDGKFTFTALTPGKYNIQATYVGYQAIKVADVVVNSGKITFVPAIKASSGSENLDEFVVIEYEVPLISKDQTSSGGTVTAEDIKKMPGRSAASIAATVGGVYSKDDGTTNMNVRGSRSSGTDTYIDGIKVRGSQNLPKSAIEQVSVVTGGIPAQFGDVTGGIINITTKGASKEWFGGIEYLTSGFKSGDDVIGLDKYGFNLLGWSVSGPLKTKKDSLGNKKDAIAGFFLSGEFKHEVDPRPYRGGDWKLNDEVMNDLNEAPYTQNLLDIGGVVNNAEFLRTSDMEKTPFRLNVARKSFNLAGKIDITTSKTTNVAIGGSYVYSDRNGYQRRDALLNYQNNPQVLDNTWRAYARFTQRFANSSDEENPSLVKDAFITFQVDYSKVNRTVQSEEHQEKLSNYGYIGKFTTVRKDTFQLEEFSSQVNGVNVDTTFGYLSSYEVTAYNFEAGELNPVLANYTSNYYEAFADNPEGFLDNMENVATFGGLINGQRPDNVYSLWNSMGGPYNAYQNSEDAQFRISASGSAGIKDHSIQIGFEYEQIVIRALNVSSPAGLWNLGRQLVNGQIAERDREQGNYDSLLLNTSSGIYNYYFDQAYNAASHSTFDKNLRESLGMDIDGLNWIDFDSYGPDAWDIGMFSADELINGGGYVNNYGYDHAGNKLSGNPTLDDFFNKKDDNGDYLRESPAFRPIYVAGYIQDKFAFDDLVFNVGVRVDRYDANQPVLKDPYSLLPIKNLGEIQNELSQANNVEVPSNIGDDFAVYVADASNPNANDIVGYRDGDTWYNTDGEEISDPSALHSTGVPQPWLVNSNETDVFTNLNGESFKDYEPQVNISPRIAFSFPISDEALFFAHYDVLTQRPSGGVNRLDLISYLAFNDGGTNIFGNQFNNPNLRAEKTIDYELGFQQKLDNYSALKISGFYREIRDQVQVTQIIGAYPGSYQTYGNKDFGTVKGLTITYDLRTRGNVSLKASYTLQFADGTGSNTETSSALVAAGQGNLRTLTPLSFDQRHAIRLSGDYRYSSGKNYNGPVLLGKDILQNTGLNIVLRGGSGTPYTKRSRVSGSGVLINTEGSQPQDGQINTSRLPFSTTVDMKLDKNIDIKWGKGEDDDKKEATLTFYIQALNVLNAGNILNVYSFTGNASDDGFLDAAYHQNYIDNTHIDPNSFRDLYSAKMDNGGMYALPRRLRLGIN